MRKNKKKKLIIGVSAGVGIIAAGTITAVVLSNRASFYSRMSEQTQQTVGNFRYVIDVRSGEQTEKVDAQGTGDTYENVQDIEAQGTEEIDSEIEFTDGSGGGVENSEWGTVTGADSVDGNWAYPNYTITVSGKVVSVEPMTAEVTVNIATDKTSGDFVNMVVVDDKAYVNLGMMKTWLRNSNNSYLIGMGNSIPDNINFVEMDANSDVDFMSFYSETEYQGLSKAYKKSVTAGNFFVNAIKNGTGERGAGKGEDRYTLQIKETEDVEKFVASLRTMLGNSGNYFSSYLSTLSKNGLMSDEELKLAADERSLFIGNLPSIWQYLAETPAEKLNLEIDCWAKDFDDAGKYESSVYVGYTKDNTQYAISIYSELSALDKNGVSVVAPTSGTSEVARLGDFDISDFLYEVFEYFNVVDGFTTQAHGADGTEVVLLAYKDALIDDLNRLNIGNASAYRLSRNNVDTFIKRYATAKPFALVSEWDIQTYCRIRQYLNEIERLYGVSSPYYDNMLTRDFEIMGFDGKIYPLTAEVLKDGSVLLAYRVEVTNTGTSMQALFHDDLKLVYDGRTVEVLLGEEMPSEYITVDELNAYSDKFNYTMDIESGKSASFTIYSCLPREQLDSVGSIDFMLKSGKVGDIWVNENVVVDNPVDEVTWAVAEALGVSVEEATAFIESGAVNPAMLPSYLELDIEGLQKLYEDYVLANVLVEEDTEAWGDSSEVDNSSSEESKDKASSSKSESSKKGELSSVTDSSSAE